MFEATATIQNAYGIHCRPSGVIAMAAREYKGTISIISKDGKKATPSSVLSLLSLGLACGDTVTIQVEGPDEQKKGEEIAELFGKQYDFER